MMTKIEVAAWMPPRFARRAGHFSGEPNRVREGISGWGSGKGNGSVIN